MKIPEHPAVGWGILDPDPELSPETLDLLEKIRDLPRGQHDALIARAVPRYLAVETELGDEEPSEAQMIDCSSFLSNVLGDILGLP